MVSPLTYNIHRLMTRSGERVRRGPVFRIRDSAVVPFYCNPLHLFFAEWVLMLVTFSLRISFASFPDGSVALGLCLIASLSFLAGYMTLRLSYVARNYYPVGVSEYYEIRLNRLRMSQLCGVLLVVGIIMMNWVRFGLPPLFGALGANTLSYQEYGSLRQPMFAAILIIFITAPMETSSWRRWALYLFSPGCFLLYGSRGYLLIMLFQALAVFSLRTSQSRLRIYGIALATLTIAVFASNLIGNSRNSLGVDALLGFLQIKQKYHTWPPAYLWVISYVATPFSNMCWIVHAPYHQHAITFFYSLFPGELAVKSTEMTADLGSEKILDGVHTYMAKYFLDFWYFGIVGINYVWGLIAGALRAGNRLTRNFLLSGVLLACMGFMFFTDFLTILIIVLEMSAAVLIQRVVTRPVNREGFPVAESASQATSFAPRRPIAPS